MIQEILSNFWYHKIGKKNLHPVALIWLIKIVKLGFVDHKIIWIIRFWVSTCGIIMIPTSSSTNITGYTFLVLSSTGWAGPIVNVQNYQQLLRNCWQSRPSRCMYLSVCFVCKKCLKIGSLGKWKVIGSSRCMYLSVCFVSKKCLKIGSLGKWKVIWSWFVFW